MWHNRGLCYMHLKQFERALEAFEQANSISRHDSTFLHMGKVKSPYHTCRGAEKMLLGLCVCYEP